MLVFAACSSENHQTSPDETIAVVRQDDPSSPSAAPRPTRTPRPPKWDVSQLIGQGRDEVEARLGAGTLNPDSASSEFWYDQKIWLVSYEDDVAVRVRIYPENYLDPDDLRELGYRTGPPDRDTPYMRRWNTFSDEVHVSIIGYQDDGYGVTGEWQVEYVDVRLLQD